MSRFILSLLEPHYQAILDRLQNDGELKAAVLATQQPASSTINFALMSATDAPFLDYTVVFRLSMSDSLDFRVSIKEGVSRDAKFALSAKQEDWENFFKPTQELIRPYQSFWGMLRTLQSQGVCVVGDKIEFGRCARVWRIVMDHLRAIVVNNPLFYSSNTVLPEEEESQDDAVVGRYIWINHSEYGKVKIFYEFSGTGPQSVLFLHTAGSDSRQYHSLMNNATLLRTCKMFAFDLPCHGRSSLGTKQYPEGYQLTEDSYVESVSLVIQRTGMNLNQDIIVCGASMAGQICIALAIRAKELGIRGVIPCEGCAHLPEPAAIYNTKGGDSALLSPEQVCGMISPTAPEHYKQQIWWQYSSQAHGVFPGDLKFYFKGWDGRSRLGQIDTRYCPVYMLTGEYDYSCTTEASEATAQAISGAVFESVSGLGHFPLTENPRVVLPYLIRAIEHIQLTRIP